MRNKTVPVTAFYFWICLLILKLWNIPTGERIEVTFWSSLFFLEFFFFILGYPKWFGVEWLFFGLELKCYGNCVSHIK